MRKTNIFFFYSGKEQREHILAISSCLNNCSFFGKKRFRFMLCCSREQRYKWWEASYPEYSELNERGTLPGGMVSSVGISTTS